MKKNLDITRPRYSKHILQVPWPFVTSRLTTVLYKYYAIFASDFSKKNLLMALSLWTHTVS